MLHSKTFNKKTRGGRIQKLVREVYLRDDIYCGALFCKSCEDKSKARSTILVLDTNVVLNQIDLLENPAIEDVVLLSVVLQEVKNKNSSVYGRIRNLIDSPARRFVVFSNEFHRHTYVQTMAGESPNDRNDRAIRVAARWYQSHLGEAVKVLLITNDRENNRKATEEGVSAETIESYVKSLGQPALLDLLVQPASEDVTMEEVEDMRPSKRKVVYPEVEHVIREQNVFAANEFIELFCELVVSRLSIIAKRRECPADLKEGIASLIFASPRCSEIPELVALRKIFEKKYGKDFVSAATDLRPNSGVNRLAMKEQDQSRRTSIMSIGDTATLRRCQSRWMVKMCPGDTVTLAHTPQPKPLLIRQKPAKHTERDRQTGPSKALNLTIEPTNRERRTLNFGRIQKLVREVYLRDDIYCGALFCKSCEDKSKARSTILVLDTNVVLNQIDLLENPAIEDVVLLSVVLQEVKNKNSSVYGRIRNLIDSPARRFVVFSNEFHRHTYVQTMAGESPNDRNDRAIRVAARWYQSHLGEAVKVLLITNDRENNRKATEEGVSAETIESYVKSLGHPALLDLLVQPASEDVTMEEVEDMRPSKRKVVYPEHKPMSEITSGLTKVIYHQGKLRVNRYNPFEAYVGSESIGDEIIIYGRGNMNRAFDGDVVAVELLPQDQWNEEKSLSPCSQS
uniref:PIN domain-containing protein n=1 Tax=Salix viminalis TaxID=40686 RepID=A0A6N2M700_SALVM